MRNFSSALIAAAALTTFGGIAANALPIQITGNSIPTFTPAGTSDGLDGFVNNGPGLGQTHVGGFGVTDAQEAVCDPVANGFGGWCGFESDAFVGSGFVLTPNIANSDRIFVIYEPDTVTISDILAIGCDDRGADGKCVASTDLAPNVPNFVILTRKTGGPDFDLSVLPTGMSVGWYGNEIAGGAATVFGFNFFVNPVGQFGSQLKFASANDVPEPLTMSVFGAGLAGIAVIRRRRKTAKA